MTPAEIIRIARNRSERDIQTHKLDVQVGWMIAKLMRAKNIPKLEKLLREDKQPKFKEIVERIKAAPSS